MFLGDVVKANAMPSEYRLTCTTDVHIARVSEWEPRFPLRAQHVPFNKLLRGRSGRELIVGIPSILRDRTSAR